MVLWGLFWLRRQRDRVEGRSRLSIVGFCVKGLNLIWILLVGWVWLWLLWISGLLRLCAEYSWDFWPELLRGIEPYPSRDNGGRKLMDSWSAVSSFFLRITLLCYFLCWLKFATCGTKLSLEVSVDDIFVVVLKRRLVSSTYRVNIPPDLGLGMLLI